MFVLDELDKILQNLKRGSDDGANQKGQAKDRPLLISLPDLQCIDVEKLSLGKKVNFNQNISTDRERGIQTNRDNSEQMYSLEFARCESNCSSMSDIFMTMIGPILYSNIISVPERLYPAARLIFCDTISYGYLTKLKRITLDNRSSSNSMDKNFIYKRPFNISMVSLLDDIKDQIDRQSEPLIVENYNATLRKRIPIFNYTIVKQIFPYIKLSDIVIIVSDVDLISEEKHDMDSNRMHNIVEFLCRYSRSYQIIELKTLMKTIGKIHGVYENVTSFNLRLSYGSGWSLSCLNRNFDLSHATFLSDRISHIVASLRLEVKSISYAFIDPTNQNKLIAQILSSAIKSKQLNVQSTSSPADSTVKILIMSRSYDIQAPLYHATEYGPFLEQEIVNREFFSSKVKPRFDTIDELDAKLHLVPLTDVLNKVLAHTTNLRSPAIKNTAKVPNNSTPGTLSASQSIRRHLDMVKSIYDLLNDGYLLMVRIESSMESLMNQLDNFEEDSNTSQLIDYTNTLQRVYSAFGQLASSSGNSITMWDMVRLACIMTDVINNFIQILSRTNDPQRLSKILIDLKILLLKGTDLKTALNARPNESKNLKNYLLTVENYDKDSNRLSGLKSKKRLEQIIEQLQKGHLDSEIYATIDYVTDSNKGLTGANVLILVFLGPLTPHELAKLKIHEEILKSKTTLTALYVLTCGHLDPIDFLTGVAQSS